MWNKYGLIYIFFLLYKKHLLFLLGLIFFDE